MRTYKINIYSIVLAAVLAVALSLSFVVSAYTKDAARLSKQNKSKVAFTSISAAYRQGMGAFRAGRMDIAIPALEFAAQKQLLPAQLWLARIYSQGLNDTEQNDLKAFEYYQYIANRLTDIKYYDIYARFAAESFVALANYHKKGLPEIQIQSNPEAAARLYKHAALNFRDAKAQFHLGKAYLYGEGVERDIKNAYHWLTFSARKNYPPAQALLGKLFWSQILWDALPASDLDPNAKAKGLALVRVAFRNADKKDLEWIGKLHYKLSSQADAKLNAEANKFVASWLREFGKRIKTLMVIIDKKEKKPNNRNDRNNIDKRSDQGIASNDKSSPFIKVKPVIGDTSGRGFTPAGSSQNNKGRFQNLRINEA